MDRIVGIGEYAISNNTDDTIITFALGSCVALTVYSPLHRVAGMVHIALPSAGLTNDDARSCYYATTAVPFLINKVCSEYGCSKHELKIELFGGAKSKRYDDVFQIGPKNIETVKKILSSLNLRFSDTETGGTNSRTIGLDVATGKVRIALQPMVL